MHGEVFATHIEQFPVRGARLGSPTPYTCRYSFVLYFKNMLYFQMLVFTVVRPDRDSNEVKN